MMKKNIKRIIKDEVRDFKLKFNFYQKALRRRAKMARILSIRLNTKLYMIETKLGRELVEEEHRVVAKDFTDNEQPHFEKIGLFITPIYDRENDQYTFVVGEKR